MKKVMVGMSGGVDSSVAAKLLLNMNYDVAGVTLKLFSSDEENCFDKTCCSLSDVDDARRVAYKLGIEHLVFNFQDEFKRDVIDDFINSYLVAKTPNPCIECNKFIKFDKMLRRAEELGFDYIATGHYATKEYSEENGRYYLRKSKDLSKDQTYVLYNLTQYQLEKTLFPLSSYNKEDVRKIAEDTELINARKPDSQDICFVPDGDYASFIKKYTGKEFEKGDFLDIKGNIIGKHMGVVNYTIGQRKGLGISLGKKMFVVDKNHEKNTVTLGELSDLVSYEVYAEDINLIYISDIKSPLRVKSKNRYNQKEEDATVYLHKDSELKIVYDNPQIAVSKGQSVVFYQNDILVGGGKIK